MQALGPQNFIKEIANQVIDNEDVKKIFNYCIDKRY